MTIFNYNLKLYKVCLIVLNRYLSVRSVFYFEDYNVPTYIIYLIKIILKLIIICYILPIIMSPIKLQNKMPITN